MIMKKTLTGLAFSAALIVGAHAETITLSAPGAPTGPTTATYESDSAGDTVGLAPVNDAFGTYSGSGAVIENTTKLLVSVQPTGLTSGVNDYLAVMNGGSETVTLNTPGNTRANAFCGVRSTATTP